jgi:hypothetical protein
MSLNRDCGDREVSLNLIVGISYRMAAKTVEEQAERNALVEKLMEIKPNLEKSVLDQICDHLGLDEDEVSARVEARDSKNAADRAAEDRGRAEKAAKRAGLPPLTPPPPIERGPAPNVPEEK